MDPLIFMILNNFHFVIIVAIGKTFSNDASYIHDRE